MSAPAAGHLVLIGMMGVGKTTTGAALAARLGWPLRDCDTDLEERTGRTGAEIAARDGLDRLHQLEEEVLLDALAAPPPTVVTAAGSVVSSERARARLGKPTLVVWLDAPVDVLVARMAADDHRRPLERQAAETLLTERRARLEQVADLRLDARAPTGELVDRIVAAMPTG